jgi:sulfoxide reductase heme-binding subunit YedZ
VTVLPAAAGPSAYWYLTRSSGVVALILLTLAIVLGVLDVRRWRHPLWPRFVVDSLHRNASLLAIAFVAVHIVTSVLDGFAPISLADAVLPFIGSYRPFWVGLGAVAFDLLLAVLVTSLLRQRIGRRAWRAAHWLTYACWPIALFHTLGTGSDVKAGWLLVLSAACLLAVLAAAGGRLLSGWPQRARLRVGAVSAAVAVPASLAIWLPAGPLGKEWARRAGTPASLLPASAASGSRHASRTAAAGTSSSQSGALDGPFDVRFSGSIKQEVGSAPGLVAVKISSAITAPVPGELAITIEGQPLSDGGVQMSGSEVTLGPSSAPQQYRGQIVQLSGNRLVAVVRRADGHRLSLDVALTTDPGAGSVTGVLSASRAEGEGGE